MTRMEKILVLILALVAVWLFFLRGKISPSGTVKTKQGTGRAWWQEILVRLSTSKQAQGAIETGFGKVVNLFGGKDYGPSVPAETSVSVDPSYAPDRATGGYAFDNPENYG